MFWFSVGMGSVAFWFMVWCFHVVFTSVGLSRLFVRFGCVALVGVVLSVLFMLGFGGLAACVLSKVRLAMVGGRIILLSRWGLCSWGFPAVSWAAPLQSTVRECVILVHRGVRCLLVVW